LACPSHQLQHTTLVVAKKGTLNVVTSYSRYCHVQNINMTFLLVAYFVPPCLFDKMTSMTGPNQPKNFDVYFEPIVDELATLWEGVDAYDTIRDEWFKLRGICMWTMHDFPGILLQSNVDSIPKLVA
jgi:hypothetical protein